jgi:death-on-curing protein
LPGESIIFLTLDEVLAIHARILAEFGGSGAVRDLGLLESALYRPQTGYYVDLAEMAGALFESLLMNHPFIDGNKRVAFFATDVFLRLNGWKIEVDAGEAHALLLSLIESRTADFEHLVPWIRDALQPI